MDFIDVDQADFKPTIQSVVEAPAPSGSSVCVFEDDGQTGYFYALDFTRGENPIVDAVEVYESEQAL